VRFTSFGGGGGGCGCCGGGPSTTCSTCTLLESASLTFTADIVSGTDQFTAGTRTATLTYQTFTVDFDTQAGWFGTVSSGYGVNYCLQLFCKGVGAGSEWQVNIYIGGGSGDELCAPQLSTGTVCILDQSTATTNDCSGNSLSLIWTVAPTCDTDGCPTCLVPAGNSFSLST
jgi:hypothetical protein